MHCPQLSAPVASAPLILLPDKFIKAVFLNERKIFQHAHVVFCAIPFIQRFQPVTGIFCAFKAKGFLVFAFSDGTVLTGFSFAAMAAATAGKPLALVGLAQGTIHPAGRPKLLQSHFLFPISHTVFGYKRPANQRLTGFVACRSKKDISGNYSFCDLAFLLTHFLPVLRNRIRFFAFFNRQSNFFFMTFN